MLTAIQVSKPENSHFINRVLRSLEGEKKDFISRFAAKLRAVELYVKRPVFMSVNETLLKTNTGYQFRCQHKKQPNSTTSAFNQYSSLFSLWCRSVFGLLPAFLINMSFSIFPHDHPHTKQGLCGKKDPIIDKEECQMISTFDCI